MSKLINQAAVRKYAVFSAQRQRPAARFSRVSAGYLERLEERLRIMIDSDIRSIPSKGVTIK